MGYLVKILICFTAFLCCNTSFPQSFAVNFSDDLELKYYTLADGFSQVSINEYMPQQNGFSQGNKRARPLEMQLTKIPHWWSTWWACFIYIIILCAVIYLIYNFQLSRNLAVAESKQLPELNRLKSNLYTNITHEFRTPLTVILGMTDVLKSRLKKNGQNNAEESIGMIEQNSINLLKLVNEMLELSKLESSNLKLQMVKTDPKTDQIPIIILTAKATDEERITGLSYGADAYLVKPLIKAERFTHLDQLIVNRKKMRQKFQNIDFDKFIKKRFEDTEAKFVQKAITIIDKHIDDTGFSSTELASNLFLSESQVYRKLKAITGKSSAIFIRSVRLQKARNLLQSTLKNISEVAFEVGFDDPAWFSRCFKQEFGHTPSAMRN